jgi:hypothetical protein
MDQVECNHRKALRAGAEDTAFFLAAGETRMGTATPRKSFNRRGRGGRRGSWGATRHAEIIARWDEPLEITAGSKSVQCFSRQV